jgi:general stress protein 26
MEGYKRQRQLGIRVAVGDICSCPALHLQRIGNFCKSITYLRARAGGDSLPGPHVRSALCYIVYLSDSSAVKGGFCRGIELAVCNARLAKPTGVFTMKIQPQNTQELAQLAKLIETIDVAMLTMRNGNGALRGRPMAPLEMDKQGALWFLIDQHSLDDDEQESVNLSFSDLPHSTYVSLSGRCEILFDRVRINELWTEFARPWFPNGPESNGIALLKFVPHSAEYWDAPNSKMVRMFAMAASIASGRPVGLGSHDTLNNLESNNRSNSRASDLRR